MKTIYFFSPEVNRCVDRKNVESIYYSIKKRGFLKELRKIKRVKTDITKQEIFKVVIEPKNPQKPLSVKNWDVKLEKVTNPEQIFVVLDGQHISIACLILQQEKFFSIESDFFEIVEITQGMTITEFISLLNSAKSWTNKDYKGKLKTNNQYIDYMEDKIIQGKYVSDFIYSLYTIGTTNVSENLVKTLKCCGDSKMPKKLKLDANTQQNGDKLLEAFNNSQISKDGYNKGKLGKGLKKYAKDYNKSIEDLIAIINKMGKDIWYNNNVPSGSPEVKDYVENFKNWEDGN